MPLRSKTRVTWLHDESTLGIGQCVNQKTPGLTAPNMRSLVGERTDGAACSRGHR
jgi:hypothetical protein